MESRLVFQPPALRAATSVLSRRLCRTPVSSRLRAQQQCACLATTCPRRVRDNRIEELLKKTQVLKQTKSWAQPGARGKGSPSSVLPKSPTTASSSKSGPPPPPKIPSSPSNVSAPWLGTSKKTTSWDQINRNQAGTPSKARRDQAVSSQLVHDNNLDITEMLSRIPVSSKNQLQGSQTLNLEKKRPFFRRKPETGMMVAVRGNIDLAQALAILGSKVAANKVVQTMRKQMEHERPGKRRKRLRSERWKKNFSEGFKACVTRANQLAKMGW